MLDDAAFLIVEAIVEAQLLGEETSLVVCPRTADDGATSYFGDLSRDAADCTGSARDEYRLAVLEGPDL